MRNTYLLLAWCILISMPSIAQPEKKAIESAIIFFFDGLSELSEAKLEANSTTDFTLLEDGEVWTLDSLANNMNRLKNVPFKRVNRFEFFKTEQTGNVAWVCYHNYADFTINNRPRKVHWLESAVLLKEKNTWKIQVLHSTKIN